MESTEVIIARLVLGKPFLAGELNFVMLFHLFFTNFLGYLKEEKCRTAYKEFLTTSEHLQSDLVTKTKYLPTRFVGLTLSDILCEYFEISKIG